MMALVDRQSAMLLGELLDGLAPFSSDDGPLITGLSLDSRRVQPGWLFLACAGGRAHGLAFVEEARARGAAAVAAEPDDRWDGDAIRGLSDRLSLPVIPLPGLRRRASLLGARFYGEPSAALQVIGVTGTNGKTSVTHYLAQALASDLACAVIGTIGVGFPGETSPADLTTPDPVSLQQALAWLRDRGAGAVAMEVSSHALEQGRAAAVRFSHAVFTNLSRDHLDYHGDMVAYAKAKRTLFRMPGLGWAVVNLDDPLSTDIIGDLDPTVRLACYSLSANAPPPDGCELWLRARNLTPNPGGLHLDLESSLGNGTVDVALIGRFNAANLLAVLAVLLSRGTTLDRALRSLSLVQGVPGRMERFGGSDCPLVVVDYAHTPDALQEALVALREHGSGRLTCVFGCGGERDAGKRPLMGAVAERLSDRVIVTDDNPRGEDGGEIVEQVLSGMSQPERVLVERQRSLAIRRAIATAGADDLVLVAGKGHETVQDLGELKIHFSDRAQVQQVLAELTAMPNPRSGGDG